MKKGNRIKAGDIIHILDEIYDRYIPCTVIKTEIKSYLFSPSILCISFQNNEGIGEMYYHPDTKTLCDSRLRPIKDFLVNEKRI